MKTNIKREDIYNRLTVLAEKRSVRVVCYVHDKLKGRLRDNLGGFYCGTRGTVGPFIWLNPSSKGKSREWVLAHELGHHMHIACYKGVKLAPLMPQNAEEAKHRDYCEDRADRFADKIIALLERKYGKEN